MITHLGKGRWEIFNSLKFHFFVVVFQGQGLQQATDGRNSHLNSRKNRKRKKITGVKLLLATSLSDICFDEAPNEDVFNHWAATGYPPPPTTETH